MTNPLLGWQRLDDVYYRLRPCGGDSDSVPNFPPRPWRSASLSPELRLLAVVSSDYDYIRVCLFRGVPVAEIVWLQLQLGVLCDCLWLQDGREDLYLVSATGTIRHYYDYANNDFHQVPVELPANALVVRVTHWEHGLVLLLDNASARVVYYSQFWPPHGHHLDPLVLVAVPLSHDSAVHSLVVVADPSHPKLFTMLVLVDVTVVVYHYNHALELHTCQDKHITEGPFSHMRLLPNQRLLALFNLQSGVNTLVLPDVEQVYVQYDSKEQDAFGTTTAAGNLVWCGLDGLVLAYTDELRVVGPSNNLVVFYLNEEVEEEEGDTAESGVPLVCTSEDGLWVFYRQRLFLLSRVSDELVLTFMIGSTAPSAIVLDATALVHQRVANYDSILSLCDAGLMEQAVEGLLASAADELDPEWQKRLLNAAVLGKLHLDQAGSVTAHYTRALVLVRVLNQFWVDSLGLFLTYRQLERLVERSCEVAPVPGTVFAAGDSGLLNLLMKRNLHYLATRVQQELAVAYPQMASWFQPLTAHWALLKIKTTNGLDDRLLYTLVVGKLETFALQARRFNATAAPTVQLDHLCDLAYREGRLALCKYLLNHALMAGAGPVVFVHDMLFVTRFLLLLEEQELLLQKLFPVVADGESGEVVVTNTSYSHELATLGVMVLQQKVTLPHLFKLLLLLQYTMNGEVYTIRNPQLVSNFWVENIGKQDGAGEGSDLARWYYQQDRKFDLDNRAVEERLAPRAVTSADYAAEYKSRKEALQEAVTTYKQLMDHRAEARLFETQLQLLELQHELSTTYQSDFFQFPTVLAVLAELMGPQHRVSYSKCLKTAKRFHVSEAKLWYLILDTFAAERSFGHLHEYILEYQLGLNKAPPIGFEPIIAKCIAKRSHLNLEHYVDGCPLLGYKGQVLVYLKMGMYGQASTVAFNNKNAMLLQEVYQAAVGDPKAGERTRGAVKRLVDQMR